VFDLYQPLLSEPVSDWERWFAWRPVHEWNHGVIWLRPVYRRQCRPYEHLTGTKRVWRQYALRRRDVVHHQTAAPASRRVSALGNSDVCRRVARRSATMAFAPSTRANHSNRPSILIPATGPLHTF
jgi:hypothetical protein